MQYAAPHVRGVSTLKALRNEVFQAAFLHNRCTLCTRLTVILYDQLLSQWIRLCGLRRLQWLQTKRVINNMNELLAFVDQIMLIYLVTQSSDRSGDKAVEMELLLRNLNEVCALQACCELVAER
jgi:hypothetical protein